MKKRIKEVIIITTWSLALLTAIIVSFTNDSLKSIFVTNSALLIVAILTTLQVLKVNLKIYFTTMIVSTFSYLVMVNLLFSGNVIWFTFIIFPFCFLLMLTLLVSKLFTRINISLTTIIGSSYYYILNIFFYKEFKWSLIIISCLLAYFIIMMIILSKSQFKVAILNYILSVTYLLLVNFLVFPIESYLSLIIIFTWYPVSIFFFINYRKKNILKYIPKI